MAALAAAAGCAAKKPPVLEPLAAAKARNTVVLVPGITGTQLRDAGTGRTVWGDGRSLMRPKDGGYATAAALDPDPVRSPRLVPFAPVYSLRVLVFRKVEAYGSLVRLMEANGYREGDPASPGPDDDFFIFNYDWRFGSVQAAGELAASLANLAGERGGGLTVDLICQSNAGRICRYLSRYGGATLEEAEQGTASPPAGVKIDRVILVGTANGGAMRTLREIDRGRRYIKLIGRRLRPEVLFTYRSLYEALPSAGEGRFLDRNGDPVQADLFDPADWENYGWSIFGKEAAERVRESGRTDLFGDIEMRRAYLAGSLDRAARLQRVLREDLVPLHGVRLYSVQNAYEETPDRAILYKEDGKWETAFCGDPFLSDEPYLQARACAPGDGHATVESQDDLSPSERAALAAPPFLIRGRHFQMILDPATQRRLLEFLAD